MQERSLKVYNTDKTFFVKISNKLTQLLMPTKFGINNIMISINSLTCSGSASGMLSSIKSLRLI